jgi:hypothetical protein
MAPSRKEIEERTQPVRCIANVEVTETDIKLPEGYVIEDMPKDASMDTDFLSFEIRYSFEEVYLGSGASGWRAMPKCRRQSSPRWLHSRGVLARDADNGHSAAGQRNDGGPGTVNRICRPGTGRPIFQNVPPIRSSAERD